MTALVQESIGVIPLYPSTATHVNNLSLYYRTHDSAESFYVTVFSFWLKTLVTVAAEKNWWRLDRVHYTSCLYDMHELRIKCCDLLVVVVVGYMLYAQISSKDV